ncbi:MAG: hypothetical protein AAGK47_06845 [Bacteroidota bacterium]
MIRFLLLAYCSLLTLVASAQFNLQVGYNVAYFPADQTNQILERFDAAQSEWENPIGTFKYGTGILAGVEYRIGALGVEAKWRNQSRTLSGSGVVMDETIFRDLLIRNHSIGVGIQGYISEIVSIGGGMDYQNFIIKSESTDIPDRTKILGENTLAGRVFLDFTVLRAAVSAIRIRPYVQFPISNIDIQSLDDTLNPNLPAEGINNENPMHWGISIYFSNGEQY